MCTVNRIANSGSLGDLARTLASFAALRSELAARRHPRAVLFFLVAALAAAPVSAQTVLVEFNPSADHNAVSPINGQPVVSSYVLQFYLLGATAPFQSHNMGKPAPQADGKIRFDTAAAATNWPQLGAVYQARVAAVGPGGTGLSDPSNQFTVPAPCSFTVAPTSLSVVAAGGTHTFTVTTASTCAWTASSGAAWIALAPTSGTGGGTVTATVTANPATTSRNGTLTIAGQSIAVTQAAAACTYTLSDTTKAVTASGGGFSVSLTTLGGCGWTAASNASWVTVTPASGSGSATVSYTVAANPTTTTRAATLTIGGKTLAISQAAAPCTFTLSSGSASLAGGAATGSVGITTTSGCAWTATSNASWLTLGTSSGNGSVTLTYSATANDSTSARTATVTVSGQTHTVTQAAGIVAPAKPANVRVTTSTTG